MAKNGSRGAHAVLLGIVALAAGCERRAPPSPAPAGSAPTPSAPAPATPAPAASSAAVLASTEGADAGLPPLPLTDAKAAIVWQPGGVLFKSVWVEPEASGVVVERSRREPVVATRSGLYAVRATQGRTASIDAVPLFAGAPVVMASATIKTCHESNEDASATLLGAVGSLVFSKAHGREQPCDFNIPILTDDNSAYDLDARAPLALGPFPGLARLQTLAGAKLRQLFGEDGGGCLVDPKEIPTFYAADFAYDSHGVLRGHYLFNVTSNYMCGSGPGLNATTVDLHDSALPDTVAFWKTAPAWLVPYLAKHPSVGVSPIPAELDLAAAAAAFTSAP